MSEAITKALEWIEVGEDIEFGPDHVLAITEEFKQLQIERDALMRWMQVHNKISKTEATILHTHGWKLDEFYSECIDAYQAIPEATRKEIEE